MKLSLSAVVFALGIAVTAAAQTAKPMPIEQLAAYNKPDREKILYAGAKTEGKATWYTSLAGESYKQLAAAFEAKYPGVKVNPEQRSGKEDHHREQGKAVLYGCARNHAAASEAST